VATKPSTAAPAAPVSSPAVEVCAAGSTCAVELQKLLADKSRDWIQERVTVSVYATGARPSAYRALRTALTCREIAQAVDEIADADEALQTPPLDVSNEQAARIRTLNFAVATELKSEHATRC